MAAPGQCSKSPFSTHSLRAKVILGIRAIRNKIENGTLIYIRFAGKYLCFSFAYVFRKMVNLSKKVKYFTEKICGIFFFIKKVQ